MSTPEIMDGGDVLIVGAGLAGLYTALKLSPRPVTVLAAAPLKKGSSSSWAQGGVAAAIGKRDSSESHAKDTHIAGAGINDSEIVDLLTKDAAKRIEDLIKLGVSFDRDEDGELVLGREAAHSARRIVRVKGDMAGREIMTSLVGAVSVDPAITVIENHLAVELALCEEQVCGVYATKAGSTTPILITARAVLIATGGVGHLYQVTTNPKAVRGEGLGMAARAGADIADPEFVQFHPTAMAVGRDPAPLATEALRGEGATIINEKGERFLSALHEDAELAPRDIVTRGIFAEMQTGEKVYLDCREAVGAEFPERFPTVFEYCRQADINPVTDPIPIAPAQHYHMGGVLTDENGRTSLSGLWAVGEVSSTGAHGANRLASNSLLEAVVFGARAAHDIDQNIPQIPDTSSQIFKTKIDHELAESLLPELRRLMSTYVGVIRKGAGLRLALQEFAVLEAEAGYTAPFSNMVAAAKMIASAALLRTESRGGHYRSDYVETDPDQAKRTVMTLSVTEAVVVEVLEATIGAAHG